MWRKRRSDQKIQEVQGKAEEEGRTFRKLKIKCKQLWLLQKGLEGAGSEKDTEGEKGGARSEKIVALEAEKSVAKVATEVISFVLIYFVVMCSLRI